MKTNRIYSFLSIMIIVFTLNSCIEDGDFTVPDVTVIEPNITANSSITAIKTALQQEFNTNNNLVYTFHVNEATPTFIEAYVVSSDATGNFYRTLVIQDKAENPTGGIEISIDERALSSTYNVGRKVYIKLDGLSVSYDDGERNIDPTNGVAGKYTLGILDGDRVNDIPSTSIKNHFFRSGTVATIVPTVITLADITEAHVNTMISLASAQFEKTQIGKTFSGEANDSFDGFRTIFECNTEKELKLQTSTFASFKSNVLPAGKGTINFVLSKDYRAEFFVAVVNTPSDISFTDVDRCDPPILDCGNGTVGGSNNVFTQDFETINSGADLTAAGWVNENVNGGSTVFASRGFGGNRYLQMSAYRTNENPLEAWLISPAINLDSSTDEALTFETKTGYNNGAALSVYVSTDYAGDIATATWMLVDGAIADGPRSGYQSNFTQSGSVNISCLSGDVYVAFRYLGGDGDVTTTFQIDNIKISGN